MSTDSNPASSQAMQQASSSAIPDESASTPKQRRFDKTRKVLSIVLATEAWKRQAGHLKHRASFPLLRQVMRTELQQARKNIALATIPTEILQRSLLSHCFILVFAVPAAIWAAYMATKGLAAGLRFDVWFNGWLLQGIPVFVFCTMKALTSNHSRQLINRELASRSLLVVKD